MRGPPTSPYSPARGPDLLPRVKTMGPRQFVSLVLTRHDWNLPPELAASKGAASEARVEQIIQRNEGYMLTMPAWQGEPRVNAHIADLHAWLCARAQGTQGSDPPQP